MNDPSRPPQDSPPPGYPNEGETGRPTPPPRQVSVRGPDFSPKVVVTIMVLTILVFVAQMASQFLLNGADYPAALGMKVNERIIRGELWRLFTPMLLHGSILHIAFNMYALYIFGPGLERHYGHWRFLLLYILGGFAGNVMSFLFSPANSLGSSTAIFGLLGAQGIFLFLNRKIFGEMAQRGLGNIVTLGLVNLVFGLTSPGIDNWGHIGGLLGGILFAWFGGPVLRVEGIYPSVSIVDARETGDVIRAGMSVAVLFIMLAAAMIFLSTR